MNWPLEDPLGRAQQPLHRAGRGGGSIFSSRLPYAQPLTVICRPPVTSVGDRGGEDLADAGREGISTRLPAVILTELLGISPETATAWTQAGGKFTGMLEYKAKLYGRTFVRIDRFFPSSKLCSACGTIAGAMPLTVREWTCACGALHDRDINAAINILTAGRRQVAAGRKPASEMGGKRRPKTPAEAGKTSPPARKRAQGHGR